MKEHFPRKTKILCTLGPSTSGVDNLVRLIYSGMDAVRLNFSHSSHDVHLQTIKEVREACIIAKKYVPILLDLQGPKIRTEMVENGEVFLQDGAEFRITSENIGVGNAQRVYTSYAELINEVQPLNTILLDDGYIILQVEKVEKNDIVTKVIKGGLLKNRKGIIVPGVSSSAPSLSDKDLEDLKFGIANGVDAVALSFVRSRRDVIELKAAMKIYGKELPIISKIERVEACENIDEIIEESTAIMVARGDLGLEMPAEKLPVIQKEIINRCNYFGKPVITATQMLESMITNPRPTRAEASDVANAVIDGTDCVMLSGETSVGRYPFDAVGYMSRIIQNIEDHYPYGSKKYIGLDENNSDLYDALANAACLIADKINASAIVTLSNATSTTKKIASYRPRIPIVALTTDENVCRRLQFIWGVTPFFEDSNELVFDPQVLLSLSFVRRGSHIVIVSGNASLKDNLDDMIKVVKV
jgi:pyruvate kinase